MVELSSSDSECEEWEDSNTSLEDCLSENMNISYDQTSVDNDLFEPLYDGASITVCGGYCALMEFKRACRLPFTTIKKLLELLHLLCPSNHKLPTSIYKLKKFFMKFTSTYNLHNFCRLCHTELQNGQKNCSNCRPTDPDTLVSFDPRRAIQQVLQSM